MRRAAGVTAVRLLLLICAVIMRTGVLIAVHGQREKETVRQAERKDS